MRAPSPDPSAAAAAAAPWGESFAQGAARRAREAADLAACRDALRRGSRGFSAAAVLLPPRVRGPATALYAFCRAADDAVDSGDPAGAGRRLAGLRGRLARCYAGVPDPDPVDRALAATVARHGVPRAMPEALLEGLAWDVEGRRYDDLAGLRAYAARVAGAVGAMMAVVMGARSAEAVARAADLGVAMQLTNVARDVGEDAAAGRMYLPLRWLREAGVSADVGPGQPPPDPAALAPALRRLLGEADLLYVRGLAGLPLLPPDCRPAIAAAAGIYRAIGGEVARAGYDSVSRRAVVPGRAKLVLAAAALPAVAARARARAAGPPLEETRFLVEARGDPAHGLATPAALPRWWRLDARWGSVVDLLVRLEIRERGGAGGGVRAAVTSAVQDGVEEEAWCAT